jgi:hypothetical protein
VARRARELEAISNHPSIGSDWELGSDDVERFANERGWWSAGRGRLDFEAAYRSTRLVTAPFSDLRLARSRRLLAARGGRLEERDFFALLRDHGDDATAPGRRQGDARWTLCAHNDVQEDTAASMVVSADRAQCWFALATPCTSVYLPLRVGAKLPEVLSRGGEQPSDDSAWWRFKRLQQAVEANWAARQPRVREAFDALEAEWLARSPDEADAEGLMQADAARALEIASALCRRFE